MMNNVSQSISKDGDNGTTPLQQMIASCSGALITSILVTPLDVVKVRLQKQVKASNKWTNARAPMTPFDVVKVRLQSQRGHLKPGHCFLYSNGLMDHLCTCSNISFEPDQIKAARHPWYLRPGNFEGTLDAFFKIARNEGVRSLWSGLPPTIAMAVPATVCYFTIYDNLNQSLQCRFGLSPVSSMFAGASARFFVVSLISPLEMIRTKMQSEKIGYTEVGKALRNNIRLGGLRVLYQGWTATILRDVPFSAIYWGGYETMKRKLMAFSGVNQATFTISFIAGALSGAVAALVTLPFDVVKTHRQIELGNKLACRDSSVKPPSVYAMLKRLYFTQGLRGLFSGAVPRVVKIAPACAIMIGTYEYFKVFFRKRNAQMRLERHRLNE